MNKAHIREIFLSIQGEGPHVGEEQLFVRFCGCNLKCAYCDTDFERLKAKEYTPDQLIKEVNSFGENLVISLTGGEPLVSVDFLKNFLPLAKQNGHMIYLETNATLPEYLKEIINYTDIISADIKLPSATGQEISFETAAHFFDIAKSKELFAKIVFNKNLTQEEINRSVTIAKNSNCEIILQPEMSGDKFSVNTEFCEHVFKTFKKGYRRVRLIPQVHKFLDIR